MPVVFPKSEFFPLPPDYGTLSKDGARKARVNAASLQGRPDLEVISWHFFRETYLRPAGQSWYKTGFSESPAAHYQWVKDWHSYDKLIHAAPRGTCKTTVNLEDILKCVVTRKYWECALFLSTNKFVADRLGRLMDQIEHNDLINNDFGKLKPHRGAGLWNRGSEMSLTNGSRVLAMPITGASLGTRPSGLLVLDDVEKSDDLVQVPSDLRENFDRFFFNAIQPMARSPGFNIPIRILGTLYNRRMFIYNLWSTKDSRIRDFWHRTLMNIQDMAWDVFDEDWQEQTKREFGIAAYNAQYMNDPGTAADRILQIHPELCTYWLDDVDEAAHNDPLNSQAMVTTHVLKGWHKPDGVGEKSEDVPIPMSVVRPFGDVVGSMRRFITVDSARTTTKMSDFSAVHVLGFENSDKHRDTLWSLDAWIGRVRYEELVRRIYLMAQKWQVMLVGVEAYAVYSEFYEMVRDALPSMYGQGEYRPRVIQIKFPTRFEKVDKIMGMEWRFKQFRVKLPLDRKEKVPAYRRLWYEVENFTEDMALLDHDDMIDTLAMHQAIGKPHKAAAADIHRPLNLVEQMAAGEVEHVGVPLMSGLNASDIPADVLDKLMYDRYVQRLEEAGLDESWITDPTVVRD